MRATSKLLALALTAALQPAFAGVVSLNFEDVTVASDPDGLGMFQLGDRYKNLGVQFSGAAWGVTSLKCDGFSLFVPHDNGCSALMLAGDPRDGTIESGKTFTMNFADGFASGSSFFYTALTSSKLSITLFDGLDGKGNSISVSALDKLAVADCDVVGARLCNWFALTMDFTGTAKSMVVSGNDETVMLDDIKLVQASTNPGRLPEPASLALSIGALGALGWARKRAAAR